MSFFENTRKPVGLGGKIMVAMMNLGHSPVARWGLQFLELAPDARVLKPGGTFFICNEANGDTDRDEKWTEIIGGMTIYKDAELKTYLEQAGFHDVQIRKKKSWLCITARK